MGLVRGWPTALFGLMACQPSTTRPTFTALPEAAVTEIRLSQLEATRQLAEGLKAESIPASRVELRDGYIESTWFDSATGHRTSRRAIGTGVVRVRAWADPARPGNTLLTVETLYQPFLDPSLPPRELEREVPKDHPVAVKVRALLQDLVKRYGGPPPPEAVQPAASNPAPAEGAEEQPAEDSGPEAADSTEP
ncbi:MAG: hypothetical protein ACJ8DC_09955 [Gemmatimonadales bacterium]